MRIGISVGEAGPVAGALCGGGETGFEDVAIVAIVPAATAMSRIAPSVEMRFI